MLSSVRVYDSRWRGSGFLMRGLHVMAQAWHLHPPGPGHARSGAGTTPFGLARIFEPSGNDLPGEEGRGAIVPSHMG